LRLKLQIPHYNGHRRPDRLTRRMRVNQAALKALPRHNFAVATYSLDIDLNVHMIYRNLACFNGKEMFIIGSRRWFKGATNGLENHIPITYFNEPSACIRSIRAKGYTLVSIELVPQAIDISAVVYPENPCFIVGNETYGITGDVIHQSDLVIQIPMNGPHPCLNVAVTSGIVVYDYLSKL